MNNEIFEACKALVKLLKEKKLKIATAESCTGGMVAAYITSVSGASEVFEMGLTTYSNRIKNQKLGVDAHTLETKGAVSYETATEMAQNVRRIASADIGVSVTGVAGPAPQDGYTAGTVFVAVSDSVATTPVKLKIEPRDRNYVREQAALQLILKTIEHIK